MDRAHLRSLLADVRAGDVDLDAATERFVNLPYEDLDFARVDHHRGLRQGLPEVVFCQGKTTEQVVAIMERLAAQGGPVLGTRAAPDVYEAVRRRVPEAIYDVAARAIVVPDAETQAPPLPGILVLTAGTADIPVAAEAVVTASLMGNAVERIFDVGVAGIHRLLDQHAALQRANVIVVVAGMDGALPSVVGGLVDVPVIACPTSTGYGAAFGGLSALLTMLTSCASGIATVNIDNGFGAGYMAGLINHLTSPDRRAARSAAAVPGTAAGARSAVLEHAR